MFSGVNIPPFPDWMKQPLVIGKNADGELLAVAVQDRFNEQEACLFRLANRNNCWVTVRAANKFDLDLYDEVWLHELRICFMKD